MRLSIVIPTWNEAEHIEDALAALQSLRRKGVEIIVVDADSADGTAGLAGPLADRVMITARGRARQMNAGATAARGELLIFLHADTRLPADADQAVRAVMQSGQRLWGRFDASIVGRLRLLRVVAASMNLRSRLTGIATGDQAMFMRRETFFAVGGFPDLPLMEDIVLSARLKRLGSPACLRARVVTSGRRWERRGLWRTILLMWWLRLQFFFGCSAAALAQHYEAKEHACAPPIAK
ncbi:TIGR04283 family arsenosugar biosynthesis glycosyltransferase [Cupriavidus sp. IK-TO18]|uniref:TIGR04283 family arsenosugar biosynthesis glycosyltransferase n=1 Tax=Cupriavidus sp. IK-TO18 TaxID=2782182 RepID=UPI001898F968|nr:TIGR04283 family arsenosugar biosynthesis glycosyltransferase [Cupriavidus sp. IK-TO18]MBF6989462.1 TIGR04283 family arsenosugar biosynthesis glycosyltransferase [Cupriavidus sp. IK-TO18]